MVFVEIEKPASGFLLTKIVAGNNSVSPGQVLSALTFINLPGATGGFPVHGAKV